MVYLATMDITKKWTMPVQGWKECISQLAIHFRERLETELAL